MSRESYQCSRDELIAQLRELPNIPEKVKEQIGRHLDALVPAKNRRLYEIQDLLDEHLKTDEGAIEVCEDLIRQAVPGQETQGVERTVQLLYDQIAAYQKARALVEDLIRKNSVYYDEDKIFKK